MSSIGGKERRKEHSFNLWDNCVAFTWYFYVIYLFIYLFTLSFHSFIHPLTHPPTIHSFINSLSRSLARSLAHSFIHSFILLTVVWLIDWLIDWLYKERLIDWLIDWLIIFYIFRWPDMNGSKFLVRVLAILFLVLLLSVLVYGGCRSLGYVGCVDVGDGCHAEGNGYCKNYGRRPHNKCVCILIS